MYTYGLVMDVSVFSKRARPVLPSTGNADIQTFTVDRSEKTSGDPKVTTLKNQLTKSRFSDT